MAKLWKSNLGYSAFRVYVDCITRLCFLRFRTSGKERSKGEPGTVTIFACNHCCALSDAIVMLVAYDGPVSFGARADIFRKKTVSDVLRWLRIVPISRLRDGLSEVAKNFAVFDEVVDVVDHGVPFCLYVEGTHRPERGLQPVQKGVCRIAARAEELLEGKKVRIVPVGIAYSDFFDHMNDVTVRYGSPILCNGLDAAAIQEQIATQLLDLIRDYPRRKPLPVLPAVLVSVLTLPLFVACAMLCLPMIAVAACLRPRFSATPKQFAWMNTVRFAAKLVLMPLLLLGWGIPAFNLLPWWGALLVLLAVFFSHSGFYLLLGLYKETLKLFKK